MTANVRGTSQVESLGWSKGACGVDSSGCRFRVPILKAPHAFSRRGRPYCLRSGTVLISTCYKTSETRKLLAPQIVLNSHNFEHLSKSPMNPTNNPKHPEALNTPKGGTAVHQQYLNSPRPNWLSPSKTEASNPRTILTRRVKSPYAPRP